MNFSLGTSYEMHLQNVTSANYRSQRKMPWDLTLNTPWEVSKKLRGEKLFNVGILRGGRVHRSGTAREVRPVASRCC